MVWDGSQVIMPICSMRFAFRHWVSQANLDKSTQLLGQLFPQRHTTCLQYTFNSEPVDP
jgi:hypothetical protein